MTRVLPLLLALIFALVPALARGADDDDDPVIGPKKLSEWLKMLREDDKWERRRGSLTALEMAGPNPRDVVPSVRAALKGDPEERVRAAAAATLGRMGPKAKDLRSLASRSLMLFRPTSQTSCASRPRPRWDNSPPIHQAPLPCWPDRR